MDIEVVFEDDWLMVINKPAGVVVNRAQSVKGDTVQDWAERKLKTKIDRSGVVHRLDKDTSGVMVIAKTAEVWERLKQAFSQRQVEKTYEALVYGRLAPKSAVMAVPVARSSLNRDKFTVAPGGKGAVTEYRVERYLVDARGNQYSLVKLWPKTGRTHQLRVHLEYLGHPIVGDRRYAGEKRVKRGVALERQWLQAKQLRLVHPVTGRLMSWEVPLADDLVKIQQELYVLA